MFSKLLIKLIDQAILPAVVLLATRIISVVLIAYRLGIPFQISEHGFTFENKQNYIEVNSYSLLSMIIVLILCISFLLIKAHVFHETHITPKLTATLFSLRLQSLVQSSFDLYTKGAIWISYAYMLAILTGVMAAYTLVFPFVFYITLAATVLSTVFFITDIEKEIKHSEEDVILDKTITYLDIEKETL